MRWPKIEEIYRVEFQKSFVFDIKTALGAERWKDLHSRVIEHVRLRRIRSTYHVEHSRGGHVL